MRILGERPELDGPLHDLVLGGLKDGDAFVRRAAAEALGLHPDASHIRPLLDLRQSSPAEDTHLVHMTRMALRDQLRPATSWPRLADLSLSERDARDIADVATGVPTPEAAAYLLGHLRRLEEPHANLVRYLQFIARHAAEADDVPLLAIVRDRGGEALPDRLALLKAILQGNQERGAKLSPSSPMPPTTFSESSSPRPGEGRPGGDRDGRTLPVARRPRDVADDGQVGPGPRGTAGRGDGEPRERRPGRGDRAPGGSAPRCRRSPSRSASKRPTGSPA